MVKQRFENSWVSVVLEQVVGELLCVVQPENDAQFRQ